MSGGAPGQPAWLPDPSGRHQHRWWDGDRFTDRVADEGAVGVDPGPTGPTPPPAPLPPPITALPHDPIPAWSPAPPAPPPAGRSRLPLLLAAVGVALAGTGAAFLLLRDDGDGTGTFTGTVDDDDVGTHEVSLQAGDALLVTVAPGSDLDAVLAALVDEDGADRLEDADEGVGYLERSRPADRLAAGTGDLDDDLELVRREDIGFAGEPEQLLLAVGEAVEVTVVVAPFDAEEDADDYEITIEVVALEVEEGADGEELLEAVEDADEVPEDFRDIAEEVLEGL